MASAHLGTTSKLGPPFLHFSPSFIPSSTVICGTLPDLSLIAFSSLYPYLSTFLSEENWHNVIVTLKSCSTSYLFCEMNQVLVLLIPNVASRHNSPSRPHALTELLAIVSQLVRKDGNLNVILVTCKPYTYSLSAAVSKAFSIFSLKTDANILQNIFIYFCLSGDDVPLTVSDKNTLACLSDGIRRAQLIVDMPTNLMDTNGFLSQILEVQEALKSFGVSLKIIEGEELNTKGMGGIFGVGKQALSQPKLVVLSYNPVGANRAYSWVGKGIMYDTGGLSLKAKSNMVGMKRDCGGAAAILGAFYTTISLQFTQTLNAVFCLAENSIGPIATRPDDIHTLYSGRTVEINNTDAEGRLVLGDGVAFAERDLRSDVIVDLATLTSAQGSATGKYHGAILSNNEEWEKRTMKIGRITGDCVFPIVYCPELHFSEFDSNVADMKNSVQNYSNATSSCAGLFIGAHISPDYIGAWVHVDMAANVASGERATGYGVSLLVGLFGKESKSYFLNYVNSLSLEP